MHSHFTHRADDGHDLYLMEMKGYTCIPKNVMRQRSVHAIYLPGYF